jgi:hypothetical protein
MSKRPHGEGTGTESARYEIRLGGHLHERWASWFDGMTVGHRRDGTTVLSGPIADQAALHGLLQRVRDLGLPLLSVRRLGTDAPNPPNDPPTDHR